MRGIGEKPEMEYRISMANEAFDDPSLEPYERWILENEQEVWRDDGMVIRRITEAGIPEPGGVLSVIRLPEAAERGGDARAAASAFAQVNAQIRACSSRHVVLCGEGISFAPDAFSDLEHACQTEPVPDFIYCDEDRIDEKGRRFDPFFKPDWSPDTLMSFLYVGRAGVFRTKLLQEIGGFDPGYGASAYYDLVLRFTERAEHICHIPKVLYHVPVNGAKAVQPGGSVHVSSDAGEQNFLNGEQGRSGMPQGCLKEEQDCLKEEQVRLKEAALKRRNLRGQVVWNEEHGEADVTCLVDGEPLVSIIIPSKDHFEMLSECLASIREKTGYQNYELIIVDNGSCQEQREKIDRLVARYDGIYVYQAMPFNFAVMCNLGARKARGEYLLFLNDDIVAVRGDWLSILLGQAQLSHAGAVGAKLLYPDSGRIQHCGIINLSFGAVHALMGKEDDRNWYFHRNQVTYDACAVTGACLMVSKKKYEDQGGMDERLAIAYNDVSLCFHLSEAGYWNCVRNDAVLLHYESASRGRDDLSKERQERLLLERGVLEKTFPHRRGDPFYSPNLTQAGSDFSLNTIYPVKPVRLRKRLGPGPVRIPCILEDVREIARHWIISGSILEGHTHFLAQTSQARRYLILEKADGACLAFPLSGMNTDQKRFDLIQEKPFKNQTGEIDVGRWYYPYTTFRIAIDQRDVKAGVRYEIVLGMERGNGRIEPYRTGYYLTA